MITDYLMQFDNLSIGIWVSGFMLMLVVLGVRVAFAAAIAGFIGLLWIFSAQFGVEKGFTVAVRMVGTIPHSKVSTLALSLIPTFILMGYLAYHAGLTKALFEAAKLWLGWLPGGMGVATVFSAAGFAAVSGASIATSAVFAKIAIPEMIKLGYDKSFAAGVVAASGTLASLIPPSAILVIYAIIVEQDVGVLLMAGFLPGITSAFIYASLVVLLAKTRKVGPSIAGFSWHQRFQSIPGTLPVFLVITIIIVCIYGGVGTPTEAGALGTLIIFCMALYRKTKIQEFKNALIETAKLAVMIFTVIWGVLIYVRFLGFAELPDAFSAWITSLDQSPIVILLLILLAYAVLGMFMDAIGMLLLTLPITFPAVIALNGGAEVSAAESAFGVSGVGCAIWFGIIVVKMAELCLITPPIGLNCFVVAGVRPECSVQDVFKGVTPFFIADVVTIGILIAFPSIVLYLPQIMGIM